MPTYWHDESAEQTLHLTRGPSLWGQALKALVPQ
jgi:hypothetical protein